MTMIVRRMDDLDRVVIPKEMRTQLDLVSGTPIEIIGGRTTSCCESSRRICWPSGCATVVGKSNGTVYIRLQ